MKGYIVTGANKGVGFGIVRRILNEFEDSFVFLCSRDQGRGDQAIQNLTKENASFAKRVAMINLDVTDEKSIEKALEEVNKVMENNGELDPQLAAIVNNAGNPSTTLKGALDLNVRGIYLVTKHFSQILKKDGKIVNVTSGGGPSFIEQCSESYKEFFLNKGLTYAELDKFMTEVEKEADGGAGVNAKKIKEMGDFTEKDPYFFYYSLAKAVANSLTFALVNEFKGFRINACTPGFIYTDMSSKMMNGDEKKAKAMGMKSIDEGAFSTIALLKEDNTASGFYFGSDGKRSPMDKYRAPGSPEYDGKDEA